MIRFLIYAIFFTSENFQDKSLNLYNYEHKYKLETWHLKSGFLTKRAWNFSQRIVWRKFEFECVARFTCIIFDRLYLILNGYYLVKFVIKILKLCKSGKIRSWAWKILFIILCSNILKTSIDWVKESSAACKLNFARAQIQRRSSVKS